MQINRDLVCALTIFDLFLSLGFNISVGTVSCRTTLSPSHRALALAAAPLQAELYKQNPVIAAGPGGQENSRRV